MKGLPYILLRDHPPTPCLLADGARFKFKLLMVMQKPVSVCKAWVPGQEPHAWTGSVRPRITWVQRRCM